MWTNWYSDDIPCAFSRERTYANATFLSANLSAEFIAFPQRARSAHPLLSLWDDSGPTSLLMLNSLAEDMRLLETKPNLAAVVHDLRDADACLPAWHTLRTAALLERARVNTVVEFVKAQNDTVPDFVIDVAGTRVPVETKLLMTSEIEDEFQRSAKLISNAIIEHARGRLDALGTTIVLKETPAQPLVPAAISKFVELLWNWKGSRLEYRSDTFNVRLERPGLAAGVAEHRLVHVLMPVPGKEALRVKGRAGTASSQLRSLPNTAKSGLLALGLSDRHDGSLIFRVLERQMRSGRYRGIAATLLLKSGVHLRSPRRTIVSLAEIRFNPGAAVPLNNEIHLSSTGPIVSLTKAEPPSLDVAAYRHLLASGRPMSGSDGFFGLNDIPRAPSELLN